MFKRQVLIVALVASGLLFESSAMATTNCGFSRDVYQPVDPDLAPKIINWTRQAEAKAGLDRMVYRFQATKPAATPAQAKMANLQAVVAEWEREPARGTVESFFRLAVGHGVNVEYETLMMTEDAKNAPTHARWRDVEAARANACLKLIQPQ